MLISHFYTNISLSASSFPICKLIISPFMHTLPIRYIRYPSVCSLPSVCPLLIPLWLLILSALYANSPSVCSFPLCMPHTLPFCPLIFPRSVQYVNFLPVCSHCSYASLCMLIPPVYAHTHPFCPLIFPRSVCSFPLCMLITPPYAHTPTLYAHSPSVISVPLYMLTL